MLEIRTYSDGTTKHYWKGVEIPEKSFDRLTTYESGDTFILFYIDGLCKFYENPSIIHTTVLEDGMVLEEQSEEEIMEALMDEDIFPTDCTYCKEYTFYNGNLCCGDYCKGSSIHPLWELREYYY